MPAVWCMDCKEYAALKYDAKERSWKFWPHGPEDKRCPGSNKPPRREKKK